MKWILWIFLICPLLLTHFTGCSKQSSNLQFSKHQLAEEDGYMVPPAKQKAKKHLVPPTK